MELNDTVTVFSALQISLTFLV